MFILFSLLSTPFRPSPKMTWAVSKIRFVYLPIGPHSQFRFWWDYEIRKHALRGVWNRSSDGKAQGRRREARRILVSLLGDDKYQASGERGPSMPAWTLLDKASPTKMSRCATCIRLSSPYVLTVFENYPSVTQYKGSIGRSRKQIDVVRKWRN